MHKTILRKWTARCIGFLLVQNALHVFCCEIKLWRLFIGLIFVQSSKNLYLFWTIRTFFFGLDEEYFFLWDNLVSTFFVATLYRLIKIVYISSVGSKHFKTKRKVILLNL